LADLGAGGGETARVAFPATLSRASARFLSSSNQKIVACARHAQKKAGVT
jgi:hypothetical protein